MDGVWCLLFLLPILTWAQAQNVHRRMEYKYSFKGPYLAQKDNQVPFWTYSGNAIASEESVRITPSLRSQKGQIWTTNPTNFEWWEVEFVFRVTGRGRIGADGLAFWFTNVAGVEGPVFGSNDQWNGLGVFFDSFDNDNKRNNPYIMAMTNDGTQVYDHEHDGLTQQTGGCLRDFRNKPFPVRVKIEYYKNILTVKTQQLQYDYSKKIDEIIENENESLVISTEAPWVSRKTLNFDDYSINDESLSNIHSHTHVHDHATDEHSSNNDHVTDEHSSNNDHVTDEHSSNNAAVDNIADSRSSLSALPGEDILAESVADIVTDIADSTHILSEVVQNEESDGWGGWFGTSEGPASTSIKYEVSESSDSILPSESIGAQELNPAVTSVTPEEKLKVPSDGKSLKSGKQRRKRKRKGKKTKKSSKHTPLFIHNGMTNNDKDYEICMRAENIHLPPLGYFGVTAATGGLADDHDVLKFIVHSLRSPDEMAQLAVNQEEEDRFKKEFDDYASKTKKAREEYIAQNPDAIKQEQDNKFETGEERELRQIFEGQSLLSESIRGLHQKMDEIVGRQERTLGLINNIGSGVAAPVGGVPPAGGNMVAGDSIKRHEVDAMLNNQRDIVSTARDIKNFVNEIHQKSNQLLTKSTQGTAQPVGFDMHVTLKEMQEGLNIVKRDVGTANHHLQKIPGGGAQACPQANCVSTSMFIGFIVLQVVLLIGYTMYRDSKEAQAKKFY